MKRSNTTKIGQITKLYDAQGFGFILAGTVVYFFHVRWLTTDSNKAHLKEGLRVEFLPHHDPEGKGNGWQAHQVRIITHDTKTVEGERL
jgi:cold shock CspA family protein